MSSTTNACFLQFSQPSEQLDKHIDVFINYLLRSWTSDEIKLVFCFLIFYIASTRHFLQEEGRNGRSRQCRSLHSLSDTLFPLTCVHTHTHFFFGILGLNPLYCLFFFNFPALFLINQTLNCSKL